LLKRQLVLLPVAILMVEGLRLVAACGGSSRATGVLHRRVGKIHTEGYGTALSVLYDLAQKAHVVIGVEDVESPSSNRLIVFDFPGGTVRQFLHLFVSQFPAYQWNEDGGIIHVRWHGAHLPLADVAMSYPGAQGQTKESMWWDIPNILEVKAWLDSHHCSHEQGYTSIGIVSPGGPPRFSVHGGSMTLAQLLDQVATKSGENYWAIVQRPPGEPCHVDIQLW